MVLLLAGCSSSEKSKSSSRVEPQIQDGFFLLQDTCRKEKEIHLLPFLKTTPADIADYLNKISEAANTTMVTLDHLKKGDDSLDQEKNPLPLVEQQVRESFTTAAKAKVLSGTKGPAYVRALLVDQLQESIYIGALAKVMSEDDTDSDRAASLRKIADKWQEIRDTGYRLLNEVK
jgi:hypothetical protein